jgi:hypothetical protein
MDQVIRYIAQQADLFMKGPEVRSAWLARREIIISSIFSCGASGAPDVVGGGFLAE